MAHFEHLTEQKLRDILLNFTLKSQTGVFIDVAHAVEDIKQQVIAAIDTNDE
ncbi:hypothetical protein ACFO4N_15295 [Camelliibacillus cellulosilyticus]|uniref:Uncharacterized protein n=1 Tax=Camelliibacillus cellulosilyticus TaxID=2174486 RepID=A0ABV9GPY9_9BACL